MSTSFQSQSDEDGSDPREEIMVQDNESEDEGDRATVGASVRDMAARIPEQLSAIGRDISRTIERAISAKDDYMLAVKVSQDAPRSPESARSRCGRTRWRSAAGNDRARRSCQCRCEDRLP